MSKILSDDERGDYERRIIQLRTAIEAIKKRAESAEEDWQLAEEQIKELKTLMQRAYDYIPKGSSLQKEFEKRCKR